MKTLKTDKPRKFFVQVQENDGNNYHPFWYSCRNTAIAKFNELCKFGSYAVTNAKSIKEPEYPETDMDDAPFGSFWM